MFDVLLMMVEIAGGIILAVLFFSFFEVLFPLLALIFLCGILLALIFGIVIGIEYFTGVNLITAIFNIFTAEDIHNILHIMIYPFISLVILVFMIYKIYSVIEKFIIKYKNKTD